MNSVQAIYEQIDSVTNLLSATFMNYDDLQKSYPNIFQKISNIIASDSYDIKIKHKCLLLIQSNKNLDLLTSHIESLYNSILSYISNITDEILNFEDISLNTFPVPIEILLDALKSLYCMDNYFNLMYKAYMDKWIMICISLLAYFITKQIPYSFPIEREIIKILNQNLKNFPSGRVITKITIDSNNLENFEIVDSEGLIFLDATNQIIRKNSALIMKSLSTRITSKFNEKEEVFNLYKKIEFENNENKSDDQTNTSNGVLYLNHCSTLWLYTTWLLYKSLNHSFSQCLTAYESTFILDPLSKLLKPNGGGSREILNIRYSQASINIGVQSLSSLINIISYIIIKDSDLINTFSQHLSLLLTYLISFAWDSPNVNNELLKTATLTIQNLIRSSWPNTSRIIDIHIVKRGTLQEVVFNHIMKPFTANSPGETLIECEKCICICNCMMLCPMANLSLKYDNKGLFSSKSYYQSIFTASFQHPALECLLCHLEIIFRIFTRLGKILETIVLCDNNPTLTVQTTTYLKNVLTNLIYTWQYNILVIGVSLVQGSQRRPSQSSQQEERAFYTFWSQGEELALYSAREKEVQILQSIYKIMVDCFEIWCSLSTLLVSNNYDLNFDLQKALFVDSFWWVLHRVSGFAASVSDDSSKKSLSSFLPNKLIVESPSCMFSRLLMMTLLHLHTSSSHAHENSSCEDGDIIMNILIKSLSRSLNCIVECNQLPWLLPWLIQTLKGSGTRGNYSLTLSSNDSSQQLFTYMFLPKLPSSSPYILKFLITFLREISNYMGSFDHDCDPKSPNAFALILGLKSVALTPLYILKYGIESLLYFFPNSESIRNWRINFEYLIELDGMNVFTNEWIEEFKPNYTISYCKGSGKYGGIEKEEIVIICTLIDQILSIAQSRNELSHLNKTNCVFICMNLFFNCILSLWAKFLFSNSENNNVAHKDSIQLKNKFIPISALFVWDNSCRECDISIIDCIIKTIDQLFLFWKDTLSLKSDQLYSYLIECKYKIIRENSNFPDNIETVEFGSLLYFLFLLPLSSGVEIYKINKSIGESWIERSLSFLIAYSKYSTSPDVISLFVFISIKFLSIARDLSYNEAFLQNPVYDEFISNIIHLSGFVKSHSEFMNQIEKDLLEKFLREYRSSSNTMKSEPPDNSTTEGIKKRKITEDFNTEDNILSDTIPETNTTTIIENTVIEETPVFSDITIVSPIKLSNVSENIPAKIELNQTTNTTETIFNELNDYISKSKDLLNSYMNSISTNNNPTIMIPPLKTQDVIYLNNVIKNLDEMKDLSRRILLGDKGLSYSNNLDQSLNITNSDRN